MAAINILNPKAEFAKAAQALSINISAARGISEVMKSNLGPKGTLKMLVSGAGDIKVTKDGNVLLHEMQIQHPTASLIAKASTAHDDIVGDGTTSIVILIGEIMKQSDNLIGEGVHPRVITDGLEIAREEAMKLLDAMAIPANFADREVLLNMARTSLRTKVHQKLADLLAEICVEAVLSIYEPGHPMDLHMIEIMPMTHGNEMQTSFVKGIVTDHGGRHPDMPTELLNCYILTCNVSLEYEKTEVNAGFFYSTAAEHEKLTSSERDFIDERVMKIIALKKEVCPPGSDKTFAVINQKGIDSISLDMLAKEGILGLRRAKRRNMERLCLACGGMAMNSVQDLSAENLGYAGRVHEQTIGENKFTFVEECKNPKSVTVLLKSSTEHALHQMKDAVQDGLRSLFNLSQDGLMLPGAGAYELALSKKLESLEIPSRSILGVKLFAKSILIIPKVLVTNAGHDAQDMILKAMQSGQGDMVVGLDLDTGDTFLPTSAGVVDNYCVKKQMIDASIVVACNLLLCDEIMRAGLSSLRG